MIDEYLFHEGCQYQLAVRRVQDRFGIYPDPICPICEAQDSGDPRGSQRRKSKTPSKSMDR